MIILFIVRSQIMLLSHPPGPHPHVNSVSIENQHKDPVRKCRAAGRRVYKDVRQE